jgi:ATF/CREB family transcription factor
MLSGPQKDDYFNDAHHLHRGFPTPNESSLRSGLTPGGGGSMFPEPSPGGIFNVMASTPGTIDFHRTAMAAASLAAPKRDPPLLNQINNITSQPQEIANGELKPGRGQFDATDAANGLYLLANANVRSEPQPVTYTMAPQQMPVHAHPPNMQMGGPVNNPSPHMEHRQHGSISTQGSNDFKEEGSEEPQSRPPTRGNGKRKRNDTSSTQTNGAATNGNRKTNGKASSKKAKTNNNHGPPSPGSEVGELDLSKEEYNTDGKKMTDEEKRKNFLERNRVAALKCRQRKKQWLANLQQKVEMYAAENESLMAQCDSLKAECVNLKTLLVAHKDCPVAQQQGLGGMSMHQVMDNYRPALDPYQMAQNGQPGVNGHHGGQPMPPQDFGRRYS